MVNRRERRVITRSVPGWLKLCGRPYSEVKQAKGRNSKQVNSLTDPASRP